MRSVRKTLSNDWYGTSRFLATTFKSSSIKAGSRREIVEVAHNDQVERRARIDVSRPPSDIYAWDQ